MTTGAQASTLASDICPALSTTSTSTAWKKSWRARHQAVAPSTSILSEGGHKENLVELLTLECDMLRTEKAVNCLTGQPDFDEDDRKTIPAAINSAESSLKELKEKFLT